MNSLSAETFAQLEEIMQGIFDAPPHGAGKPWGARRVIFLGDPCQLPPVKGTKLVGVGNASANLPSSKTDGRCFRTSKHQSNVQNRLTVRGKQLFREYLEKNIIVLDKCQRSGGLLPYIMDQIRNGCTTIQTYKMAMFLANKFHNHPYDRGVYNVNETREHMNNVQTLEDGKIAGQHVFVSFASYKVQEPSTEKWMRSVKPQDFNGANDMLLLYRGMEVTLLTNINTKLGLTNGSIGKIVQILFKKEDVRALAAGHHPQPACLIVDFPDFKGHGENSILDQYKFPKSTWVPIFPRNFKLSSATNRRTTSMFQKGDKKVRVQFPIDIAKNITAHKAQGSTWKNVNVFISIGLHRSQKPTTEQTALLYVAGTRATSLKHCLFDFIHLDTWLKLGKDGYHQALLEKESELKNNARLFAQRYNRIRLYNNVELPDYQRELSKDEAKEWEEIQAMTSMPLHQGTALSDNSDNFEHVKTGQQDVERRVFGFDLGSRNTGVALLKDTWGQKPELELLQLVDFKLDPEKPRAGAYSTSYRAVLRGLQFLQDVIRKNTTQMNMIALIEYFSIKNSWKDVLFRVVSQVLNLFMSHSHLTIKPANTQSIHSTTGPLEHLGLSSTDLDFINGVQNLQEPFPSTEDETDEEGSPPRKKRKIHDRIFSVQKNRKICQRKRKIPGQTTYKKQKDVSQKLMELFASDKDLDHLEVVIPLHVREYLRQLMKTSKLDDVGDAFLHACREVLCGSSNYREFIPGQTLFQTNRCVAVRIVANWFVLVVLHIDNLTFTLEHVECFNTNLDQSNIVFKDLHITDQIFLDAIPRSFSESLEFQGSSAVFTPVNTIHFLIRHTSGRIPHSIMLKLLAYIEKSLKDRSDFAGVQQTSFFKSNRQTFRFEGNKLLFMQQTSGKHVDARQVLPTTFENIPSMTAERGSGHRMLTEDEVTDFYQTMLTASSKVDDGTFGTLDNLRIPKDLLPAMKACFDIQTTLLTRNAGKWLSDLVLCSLNHSVVKPMYTGSLSLKILVTQQTTINSANTIIPILNPS